MKNRRRHRFIRPSTRAFVQEGRNIPGYSWFDGLHGYVYARWTYLYIGIGTGEHPIARMFRPLVHAIENVLARRGNRHARRENQDGMSDGSVGKGKVTFADGYHGKVVPLAAAEQLVTLDKEIRLTDLEHVIPYATARDIILKNPDHIVVLDCPCRVVRKNPCLPLDVCLVIGQPFADFVIEHHPNRSRRISQEEAVDILRAEHDRGHVHHAFFKDAMLGRFYAICNCCECCCGAMQAHRNGTPMLASSGYVARLHADTCTGCGTCVETCPFSAIRVEDDLPCVNADLCMGCGLCVSKCPQGALSLQREVSKGTPLELKSLLENAEG